MSLVVPEHVLTTDRSQLAEFFLGFARFEFSLKACGFARRGQWGAEVDWDNFSEAIGPLLLPPTSPELKEVVGYLLTSPPKQQVFRNSSLSWKSRAPRPGWSEMRTLLFHVQGARNNLVHGAKFVEPESGDPQRDERLLQAASCVIAECLRLCPKANRAFNGETP